MSPFTGLIKKSCLNKSKFFFKFCHFSNMVRKTNFLRISVVVSEKVTLLTKKKSSLWISPKMVQTTERHSLAECGSIWGEKQFLLIFVPFYWYDQKHLFKHIQIFLRICYFSNVVRKINFLSISMLVTEIVTFWQKIKVLCEFLRKYFKITKRDSLSVCGSL